MKKLALVLICILMLITLVACGDKTCQHRDADDNSLCDKCGESYTDGKDVFDEHTHDYNVENTDSQYLATAADCQNPATYYYSCSCGIKGTQTFSSGSVAAHTPKSAVEENRVEATCTAGHYDSVVYCSVCDEELSRETITIDAKGHTPASREENRVEATCTKDGGYDSVVYCSVCNKELSRSMVTISAAHSFKNNNCTSCGIASGIEYSLNSDGRGYILKDSDLFLGGHLVVDTYQGLPVTSIGSFAFRYCTSLTSIIIPCSVTSIGSNAFRNCTSLTSITIPSNVQKVGDDAFYNCSNLKTVTFGANSQLSSIGSSAFRNCTSLTSITIPSSVQKVNDYAFYNCSNLETVTFGANSQLSSIGYRAFYNCTSLTSIHIPSSVLKVDDYAFYNCSNLKTVTFGANSQLSSIDDSAFRYCTSLTSIKYGGTQVQWNSITKGSNWDYNTGYYTITYNYTGE